MNVLFMRRCYGRLIIMLQNMYILNHFSYMPLFHLYSQTRRHMTKGSSLITLFLDVLDAGTLARERERYLPFQCFHLPQQ